MHATGGTVVTQGRTAMPFSPIPLSPFPCHLCQQGGTIRQPNTTLCAPINRITNKKHSLANRRRGVCDRFITHVVEAESCRAPDSVSVCHRCVSTSSARTPVRFVAARSYQTQYHRREVGGVFRGQHVCPAPPVSVLSPQSSDLK